MSGYQRASARRYQSVAGAYGRRSYCAPSRQSHECQSAPAHPYRYAPYRSRGEYTLAHLFRNTGIDFEYERPTPVEANGRQSLWHPDFTLPDYDNLIVEYTGMPDRHDYRLGMDYKQTLYGLNGYRALFVWPQDLQGHAWPQRILDRLNQISRVQSDHLRR